MRKVSAKVSEIASLISGKVIGNDTAIISGTSNLKYAKTGALIKFTSPDSREFLNGKLVTAGTDNAEDRAWAKISAVVGDGSRVRFDASQENQ